MSNKNDTSNIIIQYRSKLKTDIIFKMPRKILIYNEILWISSFDDNCIFMFDPDTEMLKGTVSFPKLKNPRGIFPKGKYIYVACYGDPIDNIVCYDIESLEEIMHFKVPRPRGIVILHDEIFVTEVMENRVSVFDLSGNFKRYIGIGILQCPRGITIDSKENIIIADSANHCIVWFSKDGTFINSKNEFHSPNDVFYYNNKIFVSEWFNKCIRIYDPQTEKFEKTYTIPGKSGFLSMLSIYNDRLFVSDDAGYVHIFNIARSDCKRNCKKLNKLNHCKWNCYATINGYKI